MLSSVADAKNRLKATNEKNSIEDSGTESSEDLRVLAADLREKIQMHSSKNSAQGQKDKDVISEVAEALTKLETSLKDGEDIHLNRGKRNALLTLVANLQNHLLCSDDGPLNSPTLETSSPEYDIKSNRHRFARKRNRANRHTVGVSKEELADARKYIEDLVLMESLSNAATPDASTDTTPTSMKRNSVGDPLEEFDLPEEPKPTTLQLSKSNPKVNFGINSNRDTSQVHLRVNSQGPKTRPLSDSFPEKNVTSAYQRALERNKLQRSPEPARSRFSNKKQLMKRANTIDIPKSQQPAESESDGEDNPVGLLRAVHVNPKQKPGNKVPEFVPKTENDHKFLAFLQKTSHHHGLGWNQNKSVTNWTNKFGNIKSAFESGAVTEKSALKPPMHPHHPSKLMSKSPSQLPESKQIFSPPPQYNYQPPANLYHQKYSSHQDLQSQQVPMPKPVPINQFIHASKSVFKPVKPQPVQFQPIRNDDTYNQPKWNMVSSTSSPSGFSTHSDKWKNTSTCSSPLGGLPWTSKPTNTNSVLKLASSKFANPDPEEYKPKGSLTRGYSMKQLNTSYNSNPEPLPNLQVYQKRPSLPDTLNPYGFNTYPPQNSLTNPNLQPLILTNNNPTYYPENKVQSPIARSPKSFDDPTPYPYTSPLPPQSPHSYKRMGPVPYSADATSRRNVYDKGYLSADESMYRSQPNYISDDPDDGMEYKAETKVMKSPISHQAVKVGSRVTHGGDKNSESAKGLLDVMRRVSPKAQQNVQPQQSYTSHVQERHGPHIDNVQKQREKFDQPDDYIYEPQKQQIESKSKLSTSFEKQRQKFNKPDDYDEYQGRKPTQYLQKQNDAEYLYYEPQERPQDRPLPLDRPLPYDRKVPDPDTQMKEEELRLLKERQAEIERQLFMKAEQERVEAIEREKFIKVQQERQKEMERELFMKAKEEQLRKEEYERQMSLRAQQEELERQRALRAQQEDLERQRAARAQQEEFDRQRAARAQQEEFDRQRALRSQQEEIDRQRSLMAQQEEMERQRILRSQQEALRVQQEAMRAQQEEIQRQQILRAQQEERHLRAQREEIERQNFLKAQQYEAQQNEIERQKALKAEADRQKAMKVEIERQKSLKAESERQRGLKAQQVSAERQKGALKEKSKKSKFSDGDKKSEIYQEQQDELERQKFVKAQKEHQEFYQKERLKREEELQMLRAQKQNSIEEFRERFSESDVKVGQRRLVHIDSHELPDHRENHEIQNSIQVIEERKQSIQSQIQRMEAAVENSKPDILPKPRSFAPRKPMIRSKTESELDVERLDWQQNPIYNGSDSKPNVIFNNVSLKTRALVSQDSKEEDEEVVKSSLENNMIFKKYGPPQRHCYLPNSYQSPASSSTTNLSQSRPNLTKSVSNATTNHVTKITAQFAAQQSLERHSPEPQLRRSKSGHTLALPKMYEGKINKTELVQKQKTVEAYFGNSKSPNPEITTKASSRRFKHKTASANGSLSRSHTMPQLNDLNLLDESNIEDAFDQLISTAKL